jgi:hypothetical protein
MKQMKTISVDFDATLSRPDVQEYVKELIARGINVIVVTSRYDDTHAYRYPANPTNQDLWTVIDAIPIERHKVRFMCMKPKHQYLHLSKVVWHLDDDSIELWDINNLTGTVAISVLSGNWKQKCERILSK